MYDLLMKNVLIVQNVLRLPNFMLLTLLKILRRLGNVFTSIAETVQSKIKFSNKFFRRFLSTKSNDSFIITATNKEEICKIISSLNINKSCGPNSIPTKILHLVQDRKSKHLASI